MKTLRKRFLNLLTIICITSLFSGSGVLLAATRVEYKEVEILLDVENKTEAINQAIAQVSVEMVKSFIGEKKYKENKKKIESEIIKNKNRYILVTRTASPKVQDDKKIMIKVTLGISKENLQSVLLNHDLYYSSKQTLCILPVIYFEIKKKKNSKFIWWKDPLEVKASSSQNIASRFFKLLSYSLLKNGFYTVDPIFSRTYEQTPRSYLPRGTRLGSFMKIANFLKCNIIMSGSVVLKQTSSAAYKGHFSFKFLNTKTKSLLVSLTKKIPLIHLDKRFNSDIESLFKSLNYQLGFHKESGYLETNKLFLSIQGLNQYHDTEIFKAALIRKFNSVKDLTERVMTSQKIIYEVNTLGNSSSLVKSLNQVRIPGFSVQVIDYDKKQVELYVQPIKK